MMSLKNKRIFVIEDNVANRAIIQMLLEGEGATTAIARWGKDVKDRLLNFSPVDLIILDLMFPDGVSGYQIFDNIRAIPQLNQVPIVAVSAAEANEAIPRTQNLGFAGFIRKPVDYHIFPQQILKIIDGEQIWETS